MSNLKQFRNEDNKLIEWAWPGGYQVLYVDEWGDIVCPECANKKDADPDTEPKNKPVYGEVYYEGPDFECVWCNKRIESAYGDPDDDRVPIESV